MGWLTDLDPDLVRTLRVGLAFPEPAPAFEILALGPVRPGRSHVRLAGSSIDRPIDGLEEREAVLTIRCDPSFDDPCTLGERPENLQPPVVLSLPGPARYFHFAVQELLPPTPPRRASVRIRLSTEVPAAMIRVGDRDALLDVRAAVITAIGRGPGGLTMTVEAGVDDSREGWKYRGQRIRPGATFVFATDRYDATGVVESVTLGDPAGADKP